MSDEGFHEIQLNGKQLVFLFMAATVVSVVIFLCGVMVGRGVRAEQPTSVTADASMAPDSDSAARALEAEQPPPAPPAGEANAGAPPAEPPAPLEEMDVTSQLEAARPRDTLKTPPAAEVPEPPSASPKSAESAAPKAEPERRAEADPEPTRPAATTGPTQQGAYAVQLAALRERSEAEAMVSRLVDKGYPAYLLLPSPGKPPVYRVQVGRFESRGDAEKTASRLKKEEQFSPWVTR